MKDKELEMRLVWNGDLIWISEMYSRLDVADTAEVRLQGLGICGKLECDRMVMCNGWNGI